jgi:hypothetical protein
MLAWYISSKSNSLDKVLPVQPGKSFEIPDKEVVKYLSGYKYLAWVEQTAGRSPKMDLNVHGPEEDILLGKCKD